jgi:hypothetical protein
VRVETVSEQLFFTTTYIEGSDGQGAHWTGTGFLYVVNTNQGLATFVVTNKHVLEKAAMLAMRFVRGSGGKPLLGQQVTVQWNPFATHLWVGHETPEVDVAVLPLQPVLTNLAQSGQEAFMKTLPPELLPAQSAWEEFDELERVVFVGYPVGLYDTVNFTPIVRQGMTATPLALNYRGLPAFLIDASVYPGSSGSPVFLFDRGMYQARSGGTIVGGRLFLLGVLAAVHTQQIGAEVLETPAALVASFDQPIGLGIVFRCSAIDDCVDSLLTTAGLLRAATPPPATTPTVPSAADEQVAEATEQGP